MLVKIFILELHITYIQAVCKVFINRPPGIYFNKIWGKYIYMYMYCTILKMSTCTRIL